MGPAVATANRKARMATIGAKRHRDSRRGWRIGWLAMVDGAEIQGVKFATREEAIAYAMRVAEYEKGSQHVETKCESAAQHPRLPRLR